MWVGDSVTVKQTVKQPEEKSIILDTSPLFTIRQHRVPAETREKYGMKKTISKKTDDHRPNS
jgi:hypothetical protein